MRPRSFASARTASIFAAAAAGGSPQVRYTSTWSAAIGSAAGEDPPKYNSGNGLGGSDTRASVTV
ncbi:Uncharacterised protein [Mycobacteroides abscessus subsp. abscessus]|nr:Uncharacterised protein [Mycobacteroides abscessus subsp. abscessus]